MGMRDPPLLCAIGADELWVLIKLVWQRVEGVQFDRRIGKLN